MNQRSVVKRHMAILAFVLCVGLGSRPQAVAGSSASKDGLVEQGKSDIRPKGLYVPKGFKVQVVAAEPGIVDPGAMAFDDLGNLFVAEWRPADRSIETTETLVLPEGGSIRVRRSRKSTTDVVKRLKDVDGDGLFESSEVVVDGCEMPTSLLPWKNSLLMTCVGRIEKWSDEDGDGKFETRTILADGFAAIDRRGLSGLSLGTDGWLYLTTGDNDNHVVGSDGSRVDLLRSGGVLRSKFDGSRMTLLAMGLRNPYRGLAFDAACQPFLLDGDHEDGSIFQGVRLVNPVEEGDYGWRLRPGLASGPADFDRGAANGERPGKLPVVARLGRGSPGGSVIYNGSAFPESFRGMLIEADPARQIVRGFKVETRGASPVVKSEATLMATDEGDFHPEQVVIGADGALYVLDRRSGPNAQIHPWGEGKVGRIYRITWGGDGVTPALPTRPNNWQRVVQANSDQLARQLIPATDHAEAERALRELIDRGSSAVGPCLEWAVNVSAPLHARLLGIQGARQFWSDPVESAMVGLLNDPAPEVRRLAAQALSWEPKAPNPRLLPKLMPLLDDSDGRVIRESALAIGRHAEPRPHQTAATLLRWLSAHPKAEPSVKDGLIRALERLGDFGVEEVALAIRTRRGVDRESAVALFTALRSPPAGEQLEGLVKVPDLSPSERVALIRQFKDISPGVPAPTQGLAEWMMKHPESDPLVKLAALEACRIGGNPASTLVLALLEEDDESVRQAATRMAAQSLPPGALEKIASRLHDKSLTNSEKIAMVRDLRPGGPNVFAMLDAAYQAAEDPTLRRAALRSMADADRNRAIPALEAAVVGPDRLLRSDAVGILAESPRTAPILGKLALNRAIGRVELPVVLAALRREDGAESPRLLASIEEEATRGSTAVTPNDLRARLAQGADPWAGLGVFFRESSRCSTCHQVAGRGGDCRPVADGRGPCSLARPLAHLDPESDQGNHPRLQLDSGHAERWSRRSRERRLERRLGSDSEGTARSRDSDLRRSGQIAERRARQPDAGDRFAGVNSRRAGRRRGVPREQDRPGLSQTTARSDSIRSWQSGHSQSEQTGFESRSIGSTSPSLLSGRMDRP